ncbi:phosphoglycerate kinase [Tepidanaerobacter syntrophicus]|uniref:phosphoglycerate kinase n=1 Tax=Tepidanaerobacter syntrophicus TaxID=224999 RepID=UPI001BD26246|nr:phosphoglycerate kinase [Tepidanaerobacter syntrophicus]
METKIEITPLDHYNYKNKKVLLRVDINSPLDPATKNIVNDNRIRMSIPTIKYLLDSGAKLAIIAHQGDTLDYQNLIPLHEHAQILSNYLEKKVDYIDDVAGPAAQKRVQDLNPHEAIILGNVRYLCEEVSTFEDYVKLKPEEMLNTYIVRNLAPLFDYYVNDAFAAAHRNAPSMVAFQELLPSVGGFLLIQEVTALTKVLKSSKKPAIFVLGGAKISDAFGMMKHVLQNGIADKILATGLVGEVMLMAQGISLGEKTEKFIKDKSLDVFVQPAGEYLKDFPGKIVCPVDLAYEKNAGRCEILVEDLPINEMFMDIGKNTIKLFTEFIQSAGTIFLNGPAGVYENPLFAEGTKNILSAVSEADGYTVIGGGDTVSAASRFTDLQKYDYVCTGGGAMIRFLSGKELPLIKAMKKAYYKSF